MSTWQSMSQPAHEEPWPNIGAITVLYVLHAYQDAYQGRGLGRRLVRVVARHLRELGMPALTIAVLRSNIAAQRFYEAIGGRVVRVGEIEESGLRPSRDRLRLGRYRDDGAS